MTLPASAAWLHRDSRHAVEAAFPSRDGLRFDGHSTGAEHGAAWAVRYALELYEDGATRRARIACRSAAGDRTVELHGDVRLRRSHRR